MPRKKISLIIILSLALLTVIAVIGLVCFRPATNRTKSPMVKGGFQLEADELEGLAIKVAGATRSSFWELNFAKFVNRDAEGSFQKIQGRYFQGNRQVYQIKAKSGIVSWQERRVRFFGEVHLQSADGKELDADEVIWTPQGGKLSARGGVSFKTPEMVFETTQLDSDLNLNRIDSHGATQVRFLNKPTPSKERL